MPAAECEICTALGWDEPRVLRTELWTLTLSDNQAYLGFAFLSARRHVGSLSDLTDAEWAEMRSIINGYEAAVTNLWGADVFNWSCLMNHAFKQPDGEPHVHWKVRPRYGKAVVAGGATYVDPNFAHHYDSAARSMVTPEIRQSLTQTLKEAMHVS